MMAFALLTASFLTQLQGIWRLESIEFQTQKEQPKIGLSDFEVSGHKVSFTFGVSPCICGEMNLAFKLDGRRIDFYEGAEAKARGIYQVEGDRLKVCIDSPDRLRPTQLPTNAKSSQTLLIFRRVQRVDAARKDS